MKGEILEKLCGLLIRSSKILSTKNQYFGPQPDNDLVDTLFKIEVRMYCSNCEVL